jgi:hypothetical protein
VTRVGRRTIMTMVLIVAFTLLWNLLCHQSPRQRPNEIGVLRMAGGPNAHHAPR